MPAEAERRGIRRVRTQSLGGGRYRRIYVVDEPGPKGGHTVPGKVQRRKGEVPGSKTYDPPTPKMRPRPVKPLARWKGKKRAQA